MSRLKNKFKVPSALYLKGGGGAHAAWRDKKISAGTPSSLPSPVPYVPPRYWRTLLPDAGQPSSYARRRPTSLPRPSSVAGDSSMPCCLSSRRDWIRNLDCLNHKYVLNSKFAMIAFYSASGLLSASERNCS